MKLSKILWATTSLLVAGAITADESRADDKAIHGSVCTAFSAGGRDLMQYDVDGLKNTGSRTRARL